jgi:hypothetical protein
MAKNGRLISCPSDARRVARARGNQWPTPRSFWTKMPSQRCCPSLYGLFNVGEKPARGRRSSEPVRGALSLTLPPLRLGRPPAPSRTAPMRFLVGAIGDRQRRCLHAQQPPLRARRPRPRQTALCGRGFDGRGECLRASVPSRQNSLASSRGRLLDALKTAAKGEITHAVEDAVTPAPRTLRGSRVGSGARNQKRRGLALPVA